MSEFQQEIMGHFPETKPTTRMAWALWVCYYIRTEIFDDAAEQRHNARHLMTENAMALRARIFDLARERGIPREEMIAAKQTVKDVTRLDYGNLTRWMDQEGWHKNVLPLLADRIPPNGSPKVL